VGDIREGGEEHGREGTEEISPRHGEKVRVTGAVTTNMCRKTPGLKSCPEGGRKRGDTKGGV